jgi:hypothetical protein
MNTIRHHARFALLAASMAALGMPADPAGLGPPSDGEDADSVGLARQSARRRR